MPQPSNLDQIQAARARQLDARRKIRALPKQPARAALPNVNWHEQYMRRVAK
ncbi:MULTISPECIES: hypothetical protein [Methylobacter]